MAHPWDVYAERLWSLGYGYPLWVPEPSTEHGEVLIGDIGWIDEGRFCRLLNVTQQPTLPVNMYWWPNSSPPEFEQLELKSQFIQDQPRLIVSHALCSRDVHQIGVNVNGAGKDIGASIAFHSKADQAAILILPKQVAVGQKLVERSQIRSFVARNYTLWHQLATAQDGADLVLKEDDLLFVSGWAKTTDWVVAACSNGARDTQLALTGGLPTIAHASLTVSASREHGSSWQQRSGSSKSQHQYAVADSLLNEIAATALPFNGDDGRYESHCATRHRHSGHGRNSEFDQCIFLRYIKARRRRAGILPSLLPKIMRAAAESAGVSFWKGEDDDTYQSNGELLSEGGICSSERQHDEELEEGPPAKQRFDPTDIVLDYILKNSLAEYAVASTDDVISLCRRYDCDVEGLESAMRHELPSIILMQNGVGFVSEDRNAHPDQLGILQTNSEELPNSSTNGKISVSRLSPTHMNVNLRHDHPDQGVKKFENQQTSIAYGERVSPGDPLRDTTTHEHRRRISKEQTKEESVRSSKSHARRRSRSRPPKLFPSYRGHRSRNDRESTNGLTTMFRSISSGTIVSPAMSQIEGVAGWARAERLDPLSSTGDILTTSDTPAREALYVLQRHYRSYSRGAYRENNAHSPTVTPVDDGFLSPSSKATSIDASVASGSERILKLQKKRSENELMPHINEDTVRGRQDGVKRLSGR